MEDTALVSILVGLGIKQRRAAAFERHLDDKAPYGFSGDLLADLFHKHVAKQQAIERLFSAEAVQGKLFENPIQLDVGTDRSVRKQM